MIYNTAQFSQEGGIWIFSFADFPSLVSRFSYLQNAVFRFWCTVERFVGFLQFNLWFSVFANNNGYGYPMEFMFFFSDFAKEVTLCSLTKTVTPRDRLYPAALSLLSRLSFRGMHDKPSVFSSRYLGRNACQADFEKLKITLNQRLFLKYHAAVIISCGLWP